MSEQTTDASTSSLGRGEVWVALGAFLAMCVVVLVRAPQLLEPDDFAYRASIVALSEGHVLLSNAQYLALNAQLSVHGGGGIAQWTHLSDGQWISQKNPGYPFFAVVFQWLHALRLAPLFFGVFACGGLFYGARRWLGKWGGTYAVVLYCSSGGALIFAWRSTMPTFTDASLIAGGAGLLLGVLLSVELATPRRLALGVLAFLAIEGAVFIRYTDVTVLIVAVVAVAALYRVCAVTRAMLISWFVVVVLCSLGILEVNHLLYGRFLSTGYASGLITFTPSAIVANLERMPSRLVESLPMAVLALAAIVWVVVRLVWERSLSPSSSRRRRARRDALVALVLVAGWFSIWGLYAMYTWTVQATLGPGSAIHVVRFYIPALGLIALMAAWLVQQLPRWLPVALLTVLAGLGLWSYQTPGNHAIVGPGGGRTVPGAPVHSYAPGAPDLSPAGGGGPGHQHPPPRGAPLPG